MYEVSVPAVHLDLWRVTVSDVTYLYHKVDESLVLITGDWSVGSDHQTAVHLG